MISEVVKEFFSKWFQSRVTVEERWGSWEDMMKLNPDQVPAQYKDFVKECYEDPFNEDTDNDNSDTEEESSELCLEFNSYKATII